MWHSGERLLYLISPLEVSGSWAETVPMEVPTLASSKTLISERGFVKIGGSFTSSTETLIEVVSLNGPRLKKLESMFLFVASILRAKPLLVSKSRGLKIKKGQQIREEKIHEGSHTAILPKFHVYIHYISKALSI